MYLIFDKSVNMKFAESMKRSVFLISFLVAVNAAFCQSGYGSDSLILLNMIQTRQFAMKKKDVPAMMKQFANDATFINPAGYIYKKKNRNRIVSIYINAPGYHILLLRNRNRAT